MFILGSRCVHRADTYPRQAFPKRREETPAVEELLERIVIEMLVAVATILFVRIARALGFQPSLAAAA
jgi:hypothetical protein